MTRNSVLLILWLLLGNQASVPTEADWRWLETSREAAFEALMPVAARPDQLVAYRSYRDLYQSVPEQYFTVQRQTTGASGTEVLLATVVRPAGRSIQDQLLALHRSRPDDSLLSLLPDVSVARTTVDSTKCRPIAARLDSLSRLTLSAPRDLIIVHPLIHRLLIAIGPATVDATILDDSSALARWAVGTAVAIQRCTG